MADRRSLELRVGVFVLVAIVLAGTAIFFIGRQRHIFQSRNAYEAVFDDVEGLRLGAPVQIAGVDVGEVSRVELRQDGKIDVAFDVIEDAAHLVSEGSVASVGSPGVLGDKILMVSVGHGDPIAPGSTLPSGASSGLSALVVQLGRIAAEAEGTLTNLRLATEPLGDPRFQQDLRGATRNLSEISRLAIEGDGVVARLLTDEQMSARLDATLRNLDAASGELSRTSRSVRAIADEIRAGDGSAHALIYGDDGARLVRNAADASGEISTLLRTVREGEGTAHDLLYEDTAESIIANLDAATADIAAMTGDIRAGRGSIGGFFADPSVYEDIKRLVGDLSRNDILRALVRYSIRRDESADADPEPEVDPEGR